MSKILQGCAGCVFAFAVLFVLEHRDKNKSQPLISSLCSGEEHCLATIDNHYDKCFKSNYRVGRGGGLRSADFTNCINNAATTELFSNAELKEKLNTSGMHYGAYD